MSAVAIAQYETLPPHVQKRLDEKSKAQYGKTFSALRTPDAPENDSQFPSSATPFCWYAEGKRLVVAEGTLSQAGGGGLGKLSDEALADLVETVKNGFEQMEDTFDFDDFE